MAYKVAISESAIHDLEQILEYLAVNLENPEAAISFADELDETFSKLKRHPLLFEQSTDERLRAKGYRRFPIKKYVVFYLIDNSGKTVNIARIFYAGQDYEKYM